MNLTLLECSSYFVSNYLHQRGVFYRPDSITQSYGEYLRLRNESLGWLPKEVDNYGARADKSSYSESDPCVDVYGDSFTWGAEVSERYAWPSHMSQLLHCRVRNFGVSGYGSDQAFMRFERTSSNAPIVILNHSTENVIRNVNQFRVFLYPDDTFSLKPRFILRKEELLKVSIPQIPEQLSSEFLVNPEKFLQYEYFLPNGPSGIQFGPTFPYSFGILKAFKHWHVQAIYHDYVRHEPFYMKNHPSKALQITHAIMKEFARSAAVKGSIPIVTILPSCKDLVSYQEKGYFPYQALSISMQQDTEHFIDLGPLMYERSDSIYSLFNRCGGHYNKKGYDLVAEIIHDYIRENKLLS